MQRMISIRISQINPRLGTKLHDLRKAFPGHAVRVDREGSWSYSGPEPLLTVIAGDGGYFQVCVGHYAYRLTHYGNSERQVPISTICLWSSELIQCVRCGFEHTQLL